MLGQSIQISKLSLYNILISILQMKLYGYFLTPSILGVEKTANHLVFTFSNGYQPTSLNGAFKRLMRDSGLLKDANGHNRTLYSLRHTYATLELLRASTDIHTLAKQMGNSAAVIERHYSKLTATMAAERLA